MKRELGGNQPEKPIVTRRAEAVLSSSPRAKVIVSVEMGEKPNLDGLSREDKIRVARDLAERRMAGVTSALEQAREKDQTIVFESAWLEGTVRYEGPTGLIRELAAREDVTEVDIPHKLKRTAKKNA